MHIYFVGIGGTGIGPLSLIASQAGYKVTGSDKLSSQYTDYLVRKGISVSIDQSGKSIAEAHRRQPIDWVVSVSAILRQDTPHPEIVFARDNHIRVTEREALINEILESKNLKMIAAAGTHGKTTTTAMLVWTMQELGLPISYSIGAKTSFADMGHFEPGSQYFIYECDEFHRNFLNYRPYISAITGIAWDHHEVFPTRENYNQAFLEFISQSSHVILWKSDDAYLGNPPDTAQVQLLDDNDPNIAKLTLPGLYNRRDGWLTIETVRHLTDASIPQLVEIVNRYPGIQRRMEKLADNLYSDYAHTPEKIKACINVAQDMLAAGQKLILVYEPLTNRRQHFIKEAYSETFTSTDKLFWVPSYLAREDSTQEVLSPKQLITYVDPSIPAEAALLDDRLWDAISRHLDNGDMVVGISGGGGNSLDEWLRARLSNKH